MNFLCEKITLWKRLNRKGWNRQKKRKCRQTRLRRRQHMVRFRRVLMELRIQNRMVKPKLITEIRSLKSPKFDQKVLKVKHETSHIPSEMIEWRMWNLIPIQLLQNRLKNRVWASLSSLLYANTILKARQLTHSFIAEFVSFWGVFHHWTNVCFLAACC